jgi:hypothetical protein
MRCTRAFRVAARIDDVRSNVPLEDLGGEASHGTSARGEKVHHIATVTLLFESALDRIDLSANSADAIERARDPCTARRTLPRVALLAHVTIEVHRGRA